MIDITETVIADVRLVSTRRFDDPRGHFSEVYSRRDFAEAGIDIEFVQDNHSLSRPAGTIRGLHFQTAPFAQAKLVRVLRGAIVDVAVDLRRNSSSFGRHVAVELSAENGIQIFIPAGFAHGFCTLMPDTEVLYKTSACYAPDHDRGIAFDDPQLGIAWPIASSQAVLSDKDRRQPAFCRSEEYFT